MSVKQIEGIIYEYFVVCKINDEYKFLSVADENNKEYSKGTYFFGNNYEEIIIFQTFDEAKEGTIFGDFVRENYFKAGFDVSQLRVVSVPRKEIFGLENYDYSEKKVKYEY